jgi:hypothetical protein
MTLLGLSIPNILPDQKKHGAAEFKPFAPAFLSTSRGWRIKLRVKRGAVAAADLRTGDGLPANLNVRPSNREIFFTPKQRTQGCLLTGAGSAGFRPEAALPSDLSAQTGEQ